MPRFAVLVPGNLYKCRFFNFISPQVGMNTLYLDCLSVAGVTPEEGDLVDHLSTLFSIPYKAAMGAPAEYVGADVQNVSGLPPFPIQSASIIGQGNGTFNANLLPTQICGVIHLKTALTGRAYRGRIYIPFPGDTSQTAADYPMPTGAYLTVLAGFSAILDTNVTVTGAGGGTAILQWVLHHNKNKAGVTPSPTPIIDAPASVLFGTQRRRGNYGRQNPPPVP